MRIPFGDYAPDLADLGNPGLIQADGCVPEGIGYGPQKGGVAATAHGALTARARGSVSAVDLGGNATNFAGDATKLYRLGSGGTWADVSRSPTYSVESDKGTWAFAQFDNDIFAANYGDQMQVFNMQSSSLFEDVTTDQTAPRANFLGVVKDFLVAGDIYTQTDGPLHSAIQWSAQRNPKSWPTPGTDAAVAVLSDVRRLKGELGRITAVVSGAEVGAIFQERGIHRMDFVGGEAIFDLNDVQAERGLMAPDLAIPYGRQILFLAEDGWYLFDYTTTLPIGEDRVNRTFLADLDTAYIDRVSWATDPDRPLTYIGYPGAGNTSGTPNKVLVYNWKLQRFSTQTLAHELLCQFLAPGAHLDSTPSDTLDDGTLGPTSFDERLSRLGANELAYFNTSHQTTQFTGTNLSAIFETGDLELTPGFRSMVSKVRPLIKGTSNVQCEIGGIGRSGGTLSYKPKSRLQADGTCPARVDARYHRARITIPSGESWNEAVGIDVDAAVSGER